ncbi:MFS multidrug transporter [Xylona heveae TC161]|uniref:MFS multidrug transporter n=1 Tax=Xylona heveae (strain CBS 132557 / TC161) TaxID=1328760 RepID=A0A165IZ53_XYLHT|nr:MFS multidrug transporter [Xylona heveae TC161]KZF25574.1 MFS multidrug transporter [Xylona heveae TC161]
MDAADVDLEKAERQASPSQFPRDPETIDERLERIPTSSSTSSSSSSARGNVQATMSHVPTQGDQLDRDQLEREQTALSRIHTQRSQHSGTVGKSLRSRMSQKPLPEFGGGKSYPPPLPAKEEYVVEFTGVDDPLHAQNWPFRKKIITAAMLGFFTFTSAFGSAIFSAATGAVAHYFGVSVEVGILGLTLYVLGFASGPILWAPLSELQGRRLPLMIASFGFFIFQFAVATAKDLQTVMICRFWGGFFGACPLTVVAAVFADMFNNRSRGLAITVFAMMVFAGPLMAPFIGGFITISYLGWRWTEYITGIMGAASFILIVLFLEESYPPMILVTKASELRRRTRNWGIHAKQEEIEIDIRELVEKNFSRPLRLLVTEPIVLLISLYMSFIYGILYLFLTAYPIVFQGVHGMNEGVGGLPYFGMITGFALASLYMFLTQPSYNRKLAANKNMPVPEWRLPPVIVGGVVFAMGLFWFGWSGYKRDVHWIAPTLSGLFSGFGLLCIFLQLMNYIVDAYLMFAASALAANTFIRSIFGACFPLFGRQMFNNLGIQWAATLLGCLAAIMVPIPIVFYKYGHKIRQRSKFAPTFPKEDDE